ncbi:ACT domain-containing protein [Saccharomonospora sp. CUA-673]|uniref:ACT domain-containing protein n=1 Tax=Saccharomonospora sp. CUA-673 TaxID=1904969 RepID=UPI0021017720|nr:ACT domain-containing protein [Saccharomonospora sp. CUA-673]
MNLRRRHVPARSDVPRAWPGDVTDGDPVTATWRLRVRMDDRPGTLARVAIRLADLECNILGVTVLPVPGGVLDEIVVRPAPGITRADVIGALDHEDCECVGVADATCANSSTLRPRASARPVGSSPRPRNSPTPSGTFSPPTS